MNRDLRPRAAHRVELRIDGTETQAAGPGPTGHGQLLPADQVTGGCHAPKTPPPQHRRPGPCLAGRAAPGRLRRLLRLGGPPATTALAARPASTAKFTILTPRNGQTVHSPTPEVRLGLKGATIVPQTTTASGPTRATSTCWSTASWSP